MSYQKFYNDYQIKESHLDTFGHVNHATYLQILEEIRWDIISERGFSIEDIQRTQIGPVILEFNIKYKRELKNREKIKVESQVTKIMKKLMSFEQIIFNSEGKVAIEAVMLIGMFDLKERKLLTPNQDFYKAIGIESI